MLQLFKIPFIRLSLYLTIPPNILKLLLGRLSLCLNSLLGRLSLCLNIPMNILKILLGRLSLCLNIPMNILNILLGRQIGINHISEHANLRLRLFIRDTGSSELVYIFQGIEVHIPTIA